MWPHKAEFGGRGIEVLDIKSYNSSDRGSRRREAGAVCRPVRDGRARRSDLHAGHIGRCGHRRSSRRLQRPNRQSRRPEPLGHLRQKRRDRQSATGTFGQRNFSRNQIKQWHYEQPQAGELSSNHETSAPRSGGGRCPAVANTAAGVIRSSGKASIRHFRRRQRSLRRIRFRSAEIDSSHRENPLAAMLSPRSPIASAASSPAGQ